MKTISLTKGLHTLVDDIDFNFLSQFKWCAQRCSTKDYASRHVDGKVIRMHRFLMDAKKGEVVDHINGNSLDNRKSNLRKTTKGFNSRHRNRISIKSSGETVDIDGMYKVFFSSKYFKDKAHAEELLRQIKELVDTFPFIRQ